MNIMKRTFALYLALFSAMSLFAQADTLKIEQYCQVIVTPKLLSHKITIDIDFGEEKSFWRENRLRDYSGRIRKFNTVIDALNYMGKEGWTFINAYPVRFGETEIYHFAFKKQFPRSDIRE
jgi:hypothetical protein